jgi:DNA modification methylase
MSKPSPSATASAPRPNLDLQIEQRPIAELRAAGRKTRHHDKRQMAAIQASITQFGFVSPVLIDAAGRILAGNARVEAAKALGMTAVPAVVIDYLTPDEQRAFVLADNRLAELGKWNKEALQLEITGFSLPEIEAIRFGVGEADPVDDDLPDVKAEVTSRLGDVWRLGQHRLLVGDATSPEALTRLLAGEQVRVTFTDPPYNVPIEGHVTSAKGHGEFVQASGEMSDAQFTAFLIQVMQQIDQSLVDGGLAYVCMDWRHMEHVLSAARTAGLDLLNICVWDKGAAGMGSFYRSQHELVIVLKKGSAAHNNTVKLGTSGRNRSNVWAYEGVIGFGADKAREREMHPTPKPLCLVKDALLDSSAKGDIVLDLFGGSGTTLVAAERTGRRCRMMELDPKYADVIIRRWQATTGKEAIHEGHGVSFQTLTFGRPEAHLPPARVRVRTLV